MSLGTVLLLEPYYTGSHKVLMDVLYENLQAATDISVKMMTLTGKKWHWRARTSALYFAQNIPVFTDLKCVFTSCVLPLHELVGLRPDLQGCKKIVYFHENQLVYPVRKSKERDFQYGYNQIMTCLAADVILFNSHFNQDSFLQNIKGFFKLQPDNRPKGLREQIEPKCQVLHFPLKFNANQMESCLDATVNDGMLRIVWPHRWEHDKNPEFFFNTFYKLKDLGKVNFRLSILGETFTDNPPIFEEARNKLKDYIENFGYVAEKSDYYKILQRSDIVLSTANHEFFGVAMLEGVFQRCFPIAPNDLSYPEIFSCDKCLYKSDEDLLNKLVRYLDNIDVFYHEKEIFLNQFSLEKFTWNKLKDEYINTIVK